MSATPEETGDVADAAVVPAAGPAPKKLPPITAKDWARCRELWARGEITYKDLVAKYGRSAKTFERHFKKHKVVKGSKAKKMAERVAAEMEREEVNDAQVIAARIRETKEEHYKMASALARLSWNEVLQAKKDGKPIALALPNLKSLNAALTNLKIAREERYAILGLDRNDALDPDTIPELVIKELTAEQIEQLRKRDHLLDEDKGAVQTDDPAVAAVTGAAEGDSAADVVEEGGA